MDMFLIGQWILFGIVVLLGVVLLWKAAGYLLKLVCILVVAVIIVYGLHRYSLLPEPAQKYIDELVSQDTAQKVKDWMHQKCQDENREKTTLEDKGSKS